jgi:hypothetical protein
LKTFLKAAVVALIASLAIAGVASANTLHFRDAKRLAVKLAVQETHRHKVDRWRIFGAQRTSPREIDWVYNVDYHDGTLCDAELVVKYANNHTSLAKAFFRDVHCEH